MRELEAVAAKLPAGVVERFARKVQPLLVNNCTTSGCHQPSGAQNFQLDRAVLHGLSNRRTTLRNLVATLELVNRDAPKLSPLLAIPSGSHGGMKRSILGPRQEEQLRQLVDWVAMVTGAGLPPTVADQPAGTVPDVVPASFDEAPSTALMHPLRHGTELAPWQPKDAFDPEIFNRQTDETAAAGVDAAAEAPATR